MRDAPSTSKILTGKHFEQDSVLVTLLYPLTEKQTILK